jgi:hypothetical protein
MTVAKTGLVYVSTENGSPRLHILPGEEAVGLPEDDRKRFLQVGAIEDKLVEA